MRLGLLFPDLKSDDNSDLISKLGCYYSEFYNVAVSGHYDLEQPDSAVSLCVFGGLMSEGGLQAGYQQ